MQTLRFVVPVSKFGPGTVRTEAAEILVSRTPVELWACKVSFHLPDLEDVVGYHVLDTELRSLFASERRSVHKELCTIRATDSDY